MAVAGKSRRNLHMKKCDFNKLVLNKIFHLVVFSYMNYPVTAKYTTEKLIAR